MEHPVHSIFIKLSALNLFYLVEFAESKVWAFKYWFFTIYSTQISRTYPAEFIFDNARNTRGTFKT